jgi:hypothetical protein
MTYDLCHLNVPQADWKTFLGELPKHLVQEVIDRSDVIPDWFTPLARGVAIASQELLLRADLDRPRPTGWRSTEEGNVFELVTGVHTRFLGDIGPRIWWSAGVTSRIYGRLSSRGIGGHTNFVTRFWLSRSGQHRWLPEALRWRCSLPRIAASTAPRRGYAGSTPVLRVM